MAALATAGGSGSDSDDGFGIEFLEEQREWLCYRSWSVDRRDGALPPLVTFHFSYCGARKLDVSMELPREAAEHPLDGKPEVAAAIFHIGLVALSW